MDNLAVDFFFLLSGFVTAYAYDDRWNRMSVWTFFKNTTDKTSSDCYFSRHFRYRLFLVGSSNQTASATVPFMPNSESEKAINVSKTLSISGYFFSG
jgi:hypothetical protein